MALTIKHRGFNKWQVLDGETVTQDGLTKREAQAAAGLPVDPEPEKPAIEVKPGEPIPFEREGYELTEAERRREYERRLEIDLRNNSAPTENLFKAACHASFDQATAEHVWRQIEPVIKAGGEGIRREIKRNQRAAAA